LPNIIKLRKSRRMRWMGHAYKILVSKLEGKKQLGRPECRWDDKGKGKVVPVL